MKKKKTLSKATYTEINVDAEHSQLQNAYNECAGLEANENQRSNQRLYSLLATCQDMFQKLFVDSVSRKKKNELRNLMSAELKAQGMHVNAATDNLTLLVRYVFRGDRHRAHVYKNAIYKAMSAHVEHTELPAWIAQQGGVNAAAKYKAQTDVVTTSKAVVDARIKEVNEQIINAANALQSVPVTLNGRVLILADNNDGAITYLRFFEINQTILNSLIKREIKKSTANNQFAVDSSNNQKHISFVKAV